MLVHVNSSHSSSWHSLQLLRSLHHPLPAVIFVAQALNSKTCSLFLSRKTKKRGISVLYLLQRAPPMLRLLRLNQLSATNLAQTTRCVPASLPMPELDVTPSALKILLKTPVRATTCASLLCLTVKDLLMYSISSVSASNLKARICACILTADSFVSKEGLAS